MPRLGVIVPTFDVRRQLGITLKPEAISRESLDILRMSKFDPRQDEFPHNRKVIGGRIVDLNAHRFDDWFREYYRLLLAKVRFYHVEFPPEGGDGPVRANVVRPMAAILRWLKWKNRLATERATVAIMAFLAELKVEIQSAIWETLDRLREILTSFQAILAQLAEVVYCPTTGPPVALRRILSAGGQTGYYIPLA